MRCHRNGDMNDYVEFRIHMEELPDGLYQGLIDKGALEDCYNTIKKKLNSKSSAAAIGTSIMRWYIDQKRVLPGAFQMNGMISTYTAWMNDAEEEDKLNDYDLFRKIYNRLELV